MQELLEFCKSNRDVTIPTTFGGLHDLLKGLPSNTSDTPTSTKYSSVVNELLKNKDVVFGGSLSLYILGLLDRVPGDIDVFVPMDFEINQFLDNLSAQKNEITSETTTDIFGVEIKRVGLKINGVKVCVFYVGDNSYSLGKYGSLTIKLQPINNTIFAKKAYIKSGFGNVEKHKQDLKIIAQNLCNLDFGMDNNTSPRHSDDLPF